MLNVNLTEKLKMLQTDGGGEFRALIPYFQKCGITHCISCLHTHQQNGAIERKHRHIVEVGLSLLAHASMPQLFWVEAFQTASFLINLMPTPLLQNKSPFEVRFKTPPDYRFLKVFGCLCWPCLRPYNKHKLNFWPVPCVFLGYSASHKGYIYRALDSECVYVSHNVIFDEICFPYYSNRSPLTLDPPQLDVLISRPSPLSTPLPVVPLSNHENPPSSSTHLSPAPHPIPLSTMQHTTEPIPSSSIPSCPTDHSNSMPNLSNPIRLISHPCHPSPSSPDSATHPPLSRTHVMRTRSQNDISKPRSLWMTQFSILYHEH